MRVSWILYLISHQESKVPISDCSAFVMPSSILGDRNNIAESLGHSLSFWSQLEF